jgi:hypothetical protein
VPSLISSCPIAVRVPKGEGPPDWLDRVLLTAAGSSEARRPGRGGGERRRRDYALTVLRCIRGIGRDVRDSGMVHSGMMALWHVN